MQYFGCTVKYVKLESMKAILGHWPVFQNLWSLRNTIRKTIHLIQQDIITVPVITRTLLRETSGLKKEIKMTNLVELFYSANKIGVAR